VRIGRRRRLAALLSGVALIASLPALLVVAPVAADTTQSNACFSPLTSTYATFPLPITGSASTSTVTAGDGTTVTVNNLGLNFVIDSSLVVAGIGAGALSAAPTLAEVGTDGLDPFTGQPATNRGVNSAHNDTTMRVTGTHTTEGTQTTTGSVDVTFYVVSDGTTSGTVVYSGGPPNPPTNSNLVPVPGNVLVVPIGLNPLSWHNDGTGPSMVFKESLGTVPAANPGGGPTPAERNAAPIVMLNNLGVQANFYCWPGASTGPTDPNTGLPGSSTGFAPGAANAIATVNVIVPPTAPTCNGETVSVGAGQSTVIDLTNNCTDPNGNFPGSSGGWNITSPVTTGTLSPTATPGVYTYDAPATDPGAPATFQFTGTDDSALTSSATTVTINVLGNLCDATPIGSSCSLSQVLTAPVIGASRTMEQAGSNVTLIDAVSVLGPDRLPGTPDDPTTPVPSPIVLNGSPQLAVGQLNQITVTNARGDDAGWDVTGHVTPFYDVNRWSDPSTQTFPVCDASNPSSWDNHCIPGDNLGWQPSAAVAHQVINGDVAAVAAGSLILPPGFFGAPDDLVSGLTRPALPASSSTLLCSTSANHSGGTFHCNAGLALSVPASAAAGVYVATLTLTLV
jgi:hypothetical protein